MLEVQRYASFPTVVFEKNIKASRKLSFWLPDLWYPFCKTSSSLSEEKQDIG